MSNEAPSPTFTERLAALIASDPDLFSRRAPSRPPQPVQTGWRRSGARPRQYPRDRQLALRFAGR